MSSDKEAIDEMTNVIQSSADQKIAVIQEKLDDEKRINEFRMKAYEMKGRIQAMDMVIEIGTVSNLIWLKQIKDSKLYKEIPEIGTWGKFCELTGKSTRYVDEQLANLNAFGEKFLRTSSDLGFGYSDLRKLRPSTNDGTMIIEADLVKIGDEEIPLDSDHAEELQIALENIIEANAKIIAEKESKIEVLETTVSAKDKQIETTNITLNKVERELNKFEKMSPEKQISIRDERFCLDMKNHKQAFDGYCIKIDPEYSYLPDDATDKMKAEYLGTIDAMFRYISAIKDTVTELYGSADDFSWTPPNVHEDIPHNID